MIEVRGLRKCYGPAEVVCGVDFDAGAGEVFGFLGPNGAGKSTTIGMLCTLVRPTSGQARVAGFDVLAEPGQVRRAIGLVFQESTLDLDMTAEENLWFQGRLYGLPASEIRTRVSTLLKVVDLFDSRTSSVRTWSGGMRRRLEIVRALVHQPRVLFLDEPTNGLDPQTRAQVWSWIKELCREHATTVFLTTHYMDEAEHCDRIAIIDAGRVIALDTPSSLKKAVAKDRVVLRTTDDARMISRLGTEFGMVAQRCADGIEFAVANAAEFVPKLFRLDVPVCAVSIATPTLDDVFLTLAGHSIRESTRSMSDELRSVSWLRVVR